MDGHAARGLLTTTADRFDLASPDDVPEVRRLLRDNPMAGSIQLSSEPTSDAHVLHDTTATVHQLIVGRRSGGGLFGVGSRAVRAMYLNGEPTPVGYLGMLRLDGDHRSNPRVILRGYRHLRDLHEADRACRFYLTSIMEENVAARRFLEGNVRGMPVYRPIGAYASLGMRVRRSSGPAMGASPVEAVDPFLADHLSRRQFATPWDGKGLAEDVTVVRDSRGRPTACAALWDRQAEEQLIVRGYAPTLRRWRRWVNAIGAPFGQPALPAVGEPLPLAYVAFMAEGETAPETDLLDAVADVHRAAAARGIDYLVAGLPAEHPLLPRLKRRFGGRVLRSRLYAVYWPDGKATVDGLDDRFVWPEVVLL